jgi:riboflavin kinase / FMN adenylyltransferase
VTVLYHSPVDVEPGRRSVALGTFDGVHLGHQRVIRAAVEHAHALGATSLVATFHPRPVSVLRPDRAPEALATLDRRIAIIESCGVDEIVVVPFTQGLASLTPERFASTILAGRLGAVEVSVGQNFRFGRGRAGDVNGLRALGSELGFGVTAAPMVEVGGEPVSSSRIREAVRAGEVEVAAAMLGRPFALEGVVVRGDGRGRELGVPTANLGMDDRYIVPAEGVYAGDAMLGERRFRAAISIGTNPTFDGERDVRIEAHLLRFSEDIYDAPISIEFRRFLRGQVAFASIDELIRQMREDIAASDSA